MIRTSILVIFVVALMAISIRRWFLALCGLVFLTVVTQHPSMPAKMMGVQGANPWNAALAVIFISWLINRSSMPRRAPTPPLITGLFITYVLMILFAGLWAWIDVDSMRRFYYRETSWVLSDGIINPLKYLCIGVMFYDGIRTRNDAWLALTSAIGSSMCYAVLMFKSMKLRILTIDYEDARRLTDKLVGLFANDIAELLAFTIWAGVFMGILYKRKWQGWLWLAGVAGTIPPFVSLKSRAGFLACTMIGLVLGVMRWRIILIVFPVVVAVTVAVVPSVRQRALTGIGAGDEVDWNEVSAGRVTHVWPAVVEQIQQSPIIGHGRFGILRTDCFENIKAREGFTYKHPHNSYLEILLDCGVVGFVICLTCMLGILSLSISLMRVRDDPLMATIGAVGMIAAVSELSAGVAGSSFFPTQSFVPYLVVWGLVVRFQVERAAHARAIRAGARQRPSMVRRQARPVLRKAL